MDTATSSNANTHENVDGAVMIGVHLMDLVNVEQCHVAADRQTNPTDLAVKSTGILLSSTLAIVILCHSVQ